MGRVLSKKKRFLLASVFCFVAFILVFGGLIHIALRPISYNMEYYGETNDEYGFFSSTNVYTRNNYEIIKNTNFDLPIVNFYYYMDGYVFGLKATTEEECAQETNEIKDQWEEAIKKDFYAREINAYKMISVRPDGAVTVYICKDAIVLSVVVGVIAFALAGLSCMFFVRSKKQKDKTEQENIL